MGAIAEREGELWVIADRVLARRPGSTRAKFKDVRRFVETRMRGLRSLLHSDPVAVRTELAKHVQRIVLMPEGKTYTATGKWDLFGRGAFDGAGGES